MLHGLQVTGLVIKGGAEEGWVSQPDKAHISPATDSETSGWSAIEEKKKKFMQERNLRRLEVEGRPQNSSRKGGRVLTNEQRVGAMGRKFLKEAVTLVTADAAAPPNPSVPTTVLRSRTDPGVHKLGLWGRQGNSQEHFVGRQL